MGDIFREGWTRHKSTVEMNAFLSHALGPMSFLSSFWNWISVPDPALPTSDSSNNSRQAKKMMISFYFRFDLLIHQDAANKGCLGATEGKRGDNNRKHFLEECGKADLSQISPHFIKSHCPLIRRYNWGHIMIIFKTEDFINWSAPISAWCILRSLALVCCRACMPESAILF